MKQRATLLLLCTCTVVACLIAPRDGAAGEPPHARPEHWALRAAAKAAYERKEYADCARDFQAAADANPWARAGSLYDAACCESLSGDRDGAFALLERATTAGFRDVDALAADQDFASLREDTRWPALLARLRERDTAFRAKLHSELARLVIADQAERRNVTLAEWKARWPVIQAHDAERRARAAKIVDAEKRLTAEDYFNAALIFQHGETEADISRAERLAMRAIALDPGHGAARWLVAASRDRQRMMVGKPQLYGTQFTRADDGTRVRYTVDQAITDEERAQWNVPPLGSTAGVPK